MSKYDSSLNASPSYQSRECIIGQYIESLAHEVVSNQDIRFERGKQDIMFFANLVDLPNFGSTFCRLSIANLLVDICGRNTEALSGLEPLEWFEILNRIRSSFEACQRNDASKFITPKLKTSSDASVSNSYPFTSHETDQEKNTILAYNHTIDLAYRDVISRVSFQYSLSFIQADLNGIFADSHIESSHVHTWNNESLSNFIDSIQFCADSSSGQLSESAQVLTELLGTIQRNLHTSSIRLRTSIQATMGSKEFKKYSDYSLLQEAVELLFTSLYFLIFGSPTIQQIGGVHLTSHQAERVGQPLASEQISYDTVNGFATTFEGSVGNFGTNIQAHSDWNNESLLPNPTSTMDMNTALYNLHDHRERLRNDVNDPLQSQLLYASQARIIPRNIRGESNLDTLEKNEFYHNPRGYQQHLYQHQTHYAQQLHHLPNANPYSMMSHQEIHDFDPRGYYGRIPFPTKIVQEESQDSLMADTPPRGLKSPGSTSKKRQRRLWSEEEKAGLISGFLKHGPKWSIIKREFPSILEGRTGQDLKDCFRNMKKKGEITVDEKGKLEVISMNDTEP